MVLCSACGDACPTICCLVDSCFQQLWLTLSGVCYSVVSCAQSELNFSLFNIISISFVGFVSKKYCYLLTMVHLG